jgi:soluble lytic murein transglycosylase-like protein
MISTLAVLLFAVEPLQVDYWIGHWADAYGIERELVRAVIEAESSGNPRAISKAGAVGLMQLMPETAAMFGVRNRFRIEENIRGGVAYLAWLRDLFGSERRLIMAAYIAGRGTVERLGLASRYSDEIHRYVARVAHLYRRNRWETLLREGAVK